MNPETIPTPLRFDQVRHDDGMRTWFQLDEISDGDYVLFEDFQKALAIATAKLEAAEKIQAGHEKEREAISGILRPRIATTNDPVKQARVVMEKLFVSERTAQELREKLAESEQKLKTANFPTQQATKCGKCGVYKHTPWRDDEHGYGYICATCLTEIYDDNTKELTADRDRYKTLAESAQEDNGRPVSYAPIALDLKWHSAQWKPGMPLPKVGTSCELAGANTDVSCDQDRAFMAVNVVGYTSCGQFGCFQEEGCWPFVERLDNCWFRPAFLTILSREGGE